MNLRILCLILMISLFTKIALGAPACNDVFKTITLPNPTEEGKISSRLNIFDHQATKNNNSKDYFSELSKEAITLILMAKILTEKDLSKSDVEMVIKTQEEPSQTFLELSRVMIELADGKSNIVIGKEDYQILQNMFVQAGVANQFQ